MKKTCIVIIDSSKSNEISVTIKTDGIEKEKKYVSERHTSQQALSIIESLLLENHLAKEDITSIEVHTGPGSFTGLRVGVCIAKTLGLLLDISVNGKGWNHPIVLNYGVDRFL